MTLLYVNNNGKTLVNEGYTVESANRGHLYGDGLFESIRVMHGKALFCDFHYMRLTAGAKALKIRVPSFFTHDFFTQTVQDLVDKCEIKEGGRVRFSLDRISGGTYRPESNEFTYFVECYPIKHNAFEMNTKGLEVDLFMELRKSKDKLSGFKTKNGLLYVMASIAAQENNLDDYLILNPQGNVLESSSANLFVVSNGVLYTPGLDEGCLGGIMRMNVINLALENGIKVYECSILPQNLLAGSELFLTNAIQGITWVGGYRTKRFGNEMSRRLVGLLNAKVGGLI
jgi:branched-subunit amino acid aminotransferase/4-amino-4-deoxychorismate lyase